MSGRKTKPAVTKLVLRAGSRLPLGATAESGGVNFAIYSKSATRMWLKLYRGAEDAEPVAEFELDPRQHRTYDFWHAFVSGAKPGWYYTWRADGPKDLATGMVFEPRRELLDPWAQLVSDATWRRGDALKGSVEPHVRAQIAAQDDYDWEGDEPLRRPLAESVIYELHVRGFTRHPSSGVTYPGTFRGLIDKIPYLKALGVTDVELLPMFAFDRQDLPPAGAALGLSNYWGYSPFAFFAPHSPYAADEDPRREFRDLVKALHAAGIGVILDVVFNHTAEGDAVGPTFGFRGLANDVFYILDPENKSRYLDFTGCGNTVNGNHPLVTQYLLECLTFWARDMHVDGFRLDLASVLSRGEDGKPIAHSPSLASIEFAEALRGVHLIAEAWDAAGLYQLGSFPGFRWAEWNGQYRDTVRRFLRGEPGLLGEIATRIAGSSDMYAPANKTPQNSINFVTCHDGFTLHDLVSYDRKHNSPNAEEDRDGRDDNYSWNSGVEGATDDPDIQQLRTQRARNFMALLLLSQGVPMFAAGDEVLRSQRGNNNAYCQDSDVSWLDWSFTPGARAMHRFTRELIALRQRHPSLKRSRFFDGSAEVQPPEIQWFGRDLETPDWRDAEARVLCFTLAGVTPGEPALHVMINMASTGRLLALPQAATHEWRRIVDTTLVAPEDVVPDGVLAVERHYWLGPHGIAVFEA